MPTIEQQKDYWEFWQQTRTDSRWSLERAHAAIQLVRDLSLDKPNILDLGCGTGWFTEQLAEFGTATGMDLNDKAMVEAQQRAPQIKFIGGNIFEHPLDLNSFDVIVALQVIAHVDDQAGFMHQAAKLLKHSGHLILSTNNRFVMQRLGAMDWGSHESSGHIENWLTKSELVKLASPQFEVLKAWTISPVGNGGVLRFVNSARLNVMLEHIAPAESLRRLKERLGLGYSIMMLARKRS